jgi:hypothetical protein
MVSALHPAPFVYPQTRKTRIRRDYERIGLHSLAKPCDQLDQIFLTLANMWSWGSTNVDLSGLGKYLTGYSSEYLIYTLVRGSESLKVTPPGTRLLRIQISRDGSMSSPTPGYVGNQLEGPYWSASDPDYGIWY